MRENQLGVDATREPRKKAKRRRIARWRRHPDIFTPAEAAVYLGFESERSLETVREHFGLVGHRVGKGLLFHRADLDAVAVRMFGKDRA
jgi:hypothetical protein